MKNHLQAMMLLIVFLSSCSGGNRLQGQQAEIPDSAIHPLQVKEDLSPLLNRMKTSRLVLLGEASHGTSEFYTWRDQITRRLLEEQEFNLIAVEGDWADVYPVNLYIRGQSGYSSAEEVLQEFDRWPEWLWANEEVADLIEWLHNFNEGRPIEEQVGFYGLDLYGMWESLEAVAVFLRRVAPERLQAVQNIQQCFDPYQGDEWAYARATLNSSENCTDQVRELLELVEDIVAERISDEDAFNALQNARVVAHAEAYYRAAVRSHSASWNIRDTHMMGTANQLLQFWGPNSKMIIWEHNTHIGDARATDMEDAGMVNVGQLAREQHGEENTFLVGFGTYRGKVVAASQWGDRAQVMDVPRARRDSWEWLLHRQGASDKIIFMKELEENDFYKEALGHRAIGVVYDPARESGNYVPSVLPRRYDAFIFINRSRALRPLD